MFCLVSYDGYGFWWIEESYVIVFGEGLFVGSEVIGEGRFDF